MPGISRAGCGLLAPQGGVGRPRFFVAAVAMLAAAGCSKGAGDQMTSPFPLGMTDTTPPYYSDGQLTLYQVMAPVPLPVRAMTGADTRTLGAAPAGTPYPRGVFLRAEYEGVEIHYTLSNVDKSSHDLWLLIDPWNEFVQWRPGVTVVNDEITVPNYGYDLEFVVPARDRIEGTITFDDTHEIAIKLAAAEQLLAGAMQGQATTGGAMFDATAVANNIFNPANRSNSVPSDPLYTPWIPPVIAGLTGFDLGLRTSEPANVAVEITIEVQDLHGDRFVIADSGASTMGPPPQVLSPPGARF
jgi:hypothetical protein